jgi:hypothetical protein
VRKTLVHMYSIRRDDAALSSLRDSVFNMYLGVEEGKGCREWIARVLALCVSRGGNCCEKVSSENNYNSVFGHYTQCSNRVRTVSSETTSVCGE